MGTGEPGGRPQGSPLRETRDGTEAVPYVEPCPIWRKDRAKARMPWFESRRLHQAPLQTGATHRRFLPSRRWGDVPGTGAVATPAVVEMVLPGWPSGEPPGFHHQKPGSNPGSRGIFEELNPNRKGVSRCFGCVFLSPPFSGPLWWLSDGQGDVSPSALADGAVEMAGDGDPAPGGCKAVLPECTAQPQPQDFTLPGGETMSYRQSVEDVQDAIIAFNGGKLPARPSDTLYPLTIIDRFGQYWYAGYYGTMLYQRFEQKTLSQDEGPRWYHAKNIEPVFEMKHLYTDLAPRRPSQIWDATHEKIKAFHWWEGASDEETVDVRKIAGAPGGAT